MTDHGAAPPSFAILDALDSGVIILDAQHRIRHWNSWIARSSGLPAGTLIGKPLWEIFPSLAASRLRNAVEEALTAGLLSQMSDALNGSVFPLRSLDGGPLLHNVIVRQLEHDGEPHCLIQIHDVTARRRAEAALRGSERRARDQLQELETLYRTAPIGLGLLDRDLRFVRINEALANFNGSTIAEHLGRNVWEVVPTLRKMAEALFHRVFATGEPICGIELHGTTLRHPGVERDWIADLYPLKRPDGTAAAVGIIMRDVTEQRRLEERERLLASELDHRIKNMLALIQALAKQTAGSAGSVAEFQQVFGARLKALAAAQALLPSGGLQRAVDLSELAHTALAPHLGSDDRLHFQLEEVPVPPDLATSLALALHELATNAAKYGALSENGGRVDLRGRVEERGTGAELCLEWREQGGPPAEEPDRKGFGMRLLERAVAAQHGGAVDMEWRREGLICRIALPLSTGAK